MRIEYSAPPPVRDAIAALGRIEDVKFSPSNRRLALASFDRLRVIVFDIALTRETEGTQISLTGAAEIATEHLSRPHGLAFIDEETVAVANRLGSVCIFALPPAEAGRKFYQLPLLALLHANDVELVHTPGSVAVVRRNQHECDLLVCNNYVHTVTRHSLRLDEDPPACDHKLLLRKWLNIPDGISVSPDQRWLAISNHGTHQVLIYENTPSLDETSDPDGILVGAAYPHGLKFTPDGNYLFVADAGTPYVHVYGKLGWGWEGVHSPLRSWRVLDDETYSRGRTNPLEGGPKVSTSTTT